MANQEIAEIRRVWGAGGLAGTVAEKRHGFDGFGDRFPVAPDIELTPVTVDGVSAEWSRGPECEEHGAVIFLHGGGYMLGSVKSHRHVASEVARAARLPTLALDYRLAPEHPFPAALDDALTAYKYMLSKGLAPNSIAIVGDSAGGGLVVALALAARDAGLPQPGCVVAISPWLDLTLSGGTMDTKADEDCLVPKEFLVELAQMYMQSTDKKHPYASPIYADLRGIAPLYILVGSTETLLDDATRLAGAAGAAEVSVRLEIWPEMLHVWPMFHPVLQEGRRALVEIGDFIRAHTASARLEIGAA